jgi:acetolactate synthase-1/2/3 large subunit
MNISGGEAIAKMLKNEGVEKVFGIIDGTYFGFYSNLEKYGIELVSPRHETTAVHMAGAYARATGKIGVCMASNGPGVANALSGIAVENTEGNRVLFISSCRRDPICYPDRGGTYQCFDHTGVIRPMAKYSETVRIPNRIPEIVKQAFRRSYQGRPGVVHVDVPENYMNGKFKFDESEFTMPEQYRRVAPVYPSEDLVERAADMLINAKKPVIHAGSGVIHARGFEELELVANTLHTPVVTSWGARGALCEGNSLSVPMIYVELNNEIRSDADCVLILGSRVGETDWWGKQPNWANPQEQTTIQVDIDDDFIGRNKPVTLGINADVKVFMQMLYKKLSERQAEISTSGRKAWFDTYLTKMEKQRAKLDEHLKDRTAPFKSAHIADVCKKEFADDSLVVFDGGNTAIWGQFFYKCTNPGGAFGTPKMGMLGAGQGQALGAAAAYPDKYVYCIIGDGAMGFHQQEIETAVRNNMKVVFLVAADKQWGMVKINQQFALKPLKTVIKKELSEDETINTNFSETRFDKLAESMGAHGEFVTTPDELHEAIKRSKDSGKCSVIHIEVDNVKHMWAPALIQFKKMHEEPAGK